MKLSEGASYLGGVLAVPLVFAAMYFAPRACEIAGGVLLLLAALWADVQFARRATGVPPRVRVGWLIVLFGTVGALLLAYGFLTAAVFAVVYLGATVLAFGAVFVFLLLGDFDVVSRVLMIAFIFVGMVVEVGGLMALFGLIP